uniref:PSI domain-containing protein n=1 Tax=Sinocyclocheilus grahami TaxID=75366 RepID=A0A672L2N7_SINGR
MSVICLICVFLFFFLVPACNTMASCEPCLANVSCLWCQTNSSCSDYPVSYVIPPASVCPLSQARWGVCWVNFEALIISMAVVCGTLLLAVSVCCCCCCCCKRRRSSRSDLSDTGRLHISFTASFL